MDEYNSVNNGRRTWRTFLAHKPEKYAKTVSDYYR